MSSIQTFLILSQMDETRRHKKIVTKVGTTLHSRTKVADAVKIILDSAACFGITTPLVGIGSLSAIDTPPSSPVPIRSGPTLLVFSAFDEVSLRSSINETIQYIKRHPTRLTDIAYTLSYRRRHLPVKAFCIINDTTMLTPIEAVSSIKSFSAAKLQGKGPAFVFTGQGAQWPRMGIELLKSSHEFRADVKTMEMVLQTRIPINDRPRWSITGELTKGRSSSRLADVGIAQPVCTALQIALVLHLKRHGITPATVAGHSSGEIAAAFAAGVLTMDEAIIVAYYRGWVVSRQNEEIQRRGCMAAVGLGREEVRTFLRSTNDVVLACENSQSSITLSGDSTGVMGVLDQIKAVHPNVFIRLLTVDTAYHSREYSYQPSSTCGD